MKTSMSLGGFAILSVAYVCSSDDWAAFQMFLDATLNPCHLVSNELESLSLASSRKEEVTALCLMKILRGCELILILYTKGFIYDRSKLVACILFLDRKQKLARRY